MSQPSERTTADNDAREYAGTEHAEDRRDGDPEVDPRDPVGGGVSSATSIIPKTTASMITAASTAFGSSEKSGASTTSVSSTRPPVISEATGVLAPADSFSELAERLVDTGIP